MDNIELKSLEEVAVEVLRETKEKATYLELFNKVAELKNFTEEERNENIARFYTDITASGNFVYCGDDYWDLKENQTLDALDSEFYSEHSAVEGEDEEKEKPKRKTKKSSKRIYTEGDSSFVDLTYSDLAEESDIDDNYNSEDESYETMDYDYDKKYDDSDDYDDEDDDNDSEYESEDYDDDDYDEDDDDNDDYDEDKYNAIMDEWEDSYDK